MSIYMGIPSYFMSSRSTLALVAHLNTFQPLPPISLPEQNSHIVKISDLY